MEVLPVQNVIVHINYILDNVPQAQIHSYKLRMEDFLCVEA